MKTKFIFLIAGLFLAGGSLKSQCTMTTPPTTVYGTPGTYTIGATGPAMYIQLCANVTMYDTLGSNQRKYYMMPGSHVVFKGGFSNFAYMQGNSTYNRIGSTGSSNFVYYETTATVTGSLTNTNTCTAVSFPTISCSGSTGIVDHSNSDLISVYPNPASDFVIINNSHATSLIGIITNALGQMERTYNIENGKTTLDLIGLSEGIYFLTLTDKNKTVGYTKIMVTK